MIDLISSAKSGDKQALAELYRANIVWLYSYIRFRVDSNSAAEDICSEVFVKAFTNIAKFRAESSFKTWLFAITRNELAKYYKNESRYVHLPEGHEDYRVEESGTIKSDYRLQSIMTKLNNRYRTILELIYLSRFSLQEAAESMGIKTNTAKVLHHRALKSAQKIALEYRNDNEN
ncbi:MAG: RNA polymerase sigma factor [Candidatus Dojkabacteria bacterium]|uniref:ECF RNA polymerase sigma factor SigW n=2 Tax=Candidatus Dojkabacteria TaxID=74243 RepID=A0A136KF78_9BACT|nr:MAG: ECF RNA polymerase sigma factor SigW [candidate division WS6 bacterium OLB21]MBW7953315.1 RNA polymerase sigma factor [Candidatus Dojkabacteria bacterium]WKZ27523.1 MAG: RNA polymerase sigma factor [Candidatus Dojkabacteria bacterium]